jgi:hypothetical protein
MPTKPENKTLVNIIKNFMDEFITRYNVFEEFSIESTSNSLYAGDLQDAENLENRIEFQLQGVLVDEKELGNYIEVFLDTNSISYSSPNEHELLNVIMLFMDDFFNQHLIIENKKERLVSNFPKKGYRSVKEKEKNEVVYKFSGLIPSRAEIENQVRVFIQTHKLL